MKKLSDQRIKDFVQYDIEYLVEDIEDRLKKYAENYAKRYSRSGLKAQDIYNYMYRILKNSL